MVEGIVLCCDLCEKPFELNDEIFIVSVGNVRMNENNVLDYFVRLGPKRICKKCFKVKYDLA